MNSDLENPMMNEKGELASGDASCTDSLVLSPSLTDLLPLPVANQQQHKNEDMWKYLMTSSEQQQDESLVVCEQPQFVPIGSLRKSQNQNSSKLDQICSRKGPKIENNLDRNKNLKGSHSDYFTPLDIKPTLSFVNVAKLFLCQACHRSPMMSKTAHMCKQGHQVCGDCFQYNKKCSVCSELLMCRNRPVEEALTKLMLLRPELFLYQSGTDNYRDIRPMRIAHQLSHKPVKCPHLACNKTVAYNGFLQHFKFDHSAVPVITTVPEYPHKFLLHQNILNSTVRVESVFKVNIFETGLKKIDGDPVICCLQSTLVQIGCVESLAVWCSSIYDGNSPLLIYDLKLPCSRKSVTYRGPLSSLHERSDCIQRDGRCLLVPAQTILPGNSVNMFQIKFFIN